MDFRLAAYRFEFRTIERVRVPRGKAGNVFRGALGESLRQLACVPDCPGAKTCPRRWECVYARFFEPVLNGGPSGLANPPRPFVLRPRIADWRVLEPNSELVLDVHVFDLRFSFLPYLVSALARVADDGLGPGRGRAVLERVCAVNAAHEASTPLYESGQFLTTGLPVPLRLPLDEGLVEPVGRMQVEFLTPTELKSEGELVQRPDFPAFMERVRDRVASLARLYADSELAFEWDAMAAAASLVRISASRLRQERLERRSSKTGQSHPLGGFMGVVEYVGELGGFVPLIEAGVWTGVGRQTVWGKGEYRVKFHR